jgi:mono/diheme cytochrome c family protein
MNVKVMIFSAVLALASAATLQAQQPADGAAVYAKTCASCHGPRGTPSPAMAIPDLASAPAMASVTDSLLRLAVVEGKGRMMPAYKGRLTPEQIQAVVAYIRTLSRQ